ASAPDQGRERNVLARPVVGDLRRVLDGVLDQSEVRRPARLDALDDAEHQVVEPLARRRPLGRPELPGEDLRAAQPALVAVADPAAAAHVPTIVTGEPHQVAWAREVACPRDSRPPLLAYRLWPPRGPHADLRVPR